MPPTAQIQFFPTVPLHYLQAAWCMQYHLPPLMPCCVEWMPAPFVSLYYGIQLIICYGSLQQVWKDLDCPAMKLRTMEITAKNAHLDTVPVDSLGASSLDSAYCALPTSWSPTSNASYVFPSNSWHVCKGIHSNSSIASAFALVLR